MRHVRKQQAAPPCLDAHRRRLEATYGNLSAACREEIVSALLRDQGALCAYCMRRLRYETTSIEHRIAGHGDRAPHALDWQNLLGVCPGGEGLPRAQQTCDTHRGNAPIEIDPVDPGHVRRLSYGHDGTLRSSDNEHQRDLDEALNLNVKLLKQARIAALTSALEAWSRKRPQGRWPDTFLENEIRDLRQRADLPEYLGIIEHEVERRLGRPLP